MSVPRLILLAVLAASAVPARADVVTLVPSQSVWKYHATGAAPAGAWTGGAYDDGAWPSGPGVLGYGEFYVATTVPYGPNADDKYRTTYFRRAFTVADPESLAVLTLGARYDDGFVAFLNGVEVARRGLAAGPVAYGTLAASHEAGGYESIDLTPFATQLVAGTNLLAVEVHQTTASSSDLVWDATLTAADGPAITRGPYLQRVAPGSAVVRWRTTVPTASVVRYGLAPLDLASTATTGGTTTEHQVAITGLAPATRVFYAVGTGDEVLAGGDSLHSFVTAPPPGAPGPFRIWAFGDAGRASAGQAQVRDAYLGYMAGRRADVWLMLGDNAYSTGLDGEYEAGLFDMYPTVLPNTPLWPARGNHDQLHAGADNDYYEFFTLPAGGEAGGVPSGSEAYYSFDHGNVHFICLDSEGSDRTPNGAMCSWLRRDLAATAATWVIAYWHHPPYTRGTHDSDDPVDSDGKMIDMRQYVLPILDSAGVDLTLTGHSHNYERSMLINGHYGLSWTLAPGMIVDGGDGQAGGTGPYQKPSSGTGPFEGTVHAVAGSAALAGGGTLDHPVMARSLNVTGSLVIDVEGGRLDARFVSGTGAVLDSFTILKGSTAGGPFPGRPSALRLWPLGPQPMRGAARLGFRLPAAGTARLTVVDVAGRRVATLVDGRLRAGEHEAVWDGRTGHGAAAPAGVYLAVLAARGEVRSVRLVRVP